MTTAEDSVTVSVTVDGVSVSETTPLRYVGNPSYHAHEVRKALEETTNKVSEMLIERFGDLPESMRESVERERNNYLTRRPADIVKSQRAIRSTSA